MKKKKFLIDHHYKTKNQNFLILPHLSESIDVPAECKWNKAFIEFNDFSKFREFDKSLKHELGSVS